MNVSACQLHDTCNPLCQNTIQHLYWQKRDKGRFLSYKNSYLLYNPNKNFIKCVPYGTGGLQLGILSFSKHVLTEFADIDSFDLVDFVVVKNMSAFRTSYIWGYSGQGFILVNNTKCQATDVWGTLSFTVNTFKAQPSYRNSLGT